MRFVTQKGKWITPHLILCTVRALHLSLLFSYSRMRFSSQILTACVWLKIFILIVSLIIAGHIYFHCFGGTQSLLEISGLPAATSRRKMCRPALFPAVYLGHFLRKIFRIACVICKTKCFGFWKQFFLFQSSYLYSS